VTGNIPPRARASSERLVTGCSDCLFNQRTPHHDWCALLGHDVSYKEGRRPYDCPLSIAPVTISLVGSVTPARNEKPRAELITREELLDAIATKLREDD
jgi:hypothetical protein